MTLAISKSNNGNNVITFTNYYYGISKSNNGISKSNNGISKSNNAISKSNNELVKVITT